MFIGDNTVPVADWLAFFPFDSDFPGSSRVGLNLIFQKISKKRKVTEMCLSISRQNGN